MVRRAEVRQAPDRISVLLPRPITREASWQEMWSPYESRISSLVAEEAVLKSVREPLRGAMPSLE